MRNAAFGATTMSPMLIDARTLPADRAGRAVRAEVCVVGAGPAGITLARELGAAGIGVCLLESGGLELDGAVQQLSDGRATGDATRMRNAYLRDTRLRVLGGTSGHWAGQTRPLDPIDFEKRAWIPDSGWPLDRAALAPHYERAIALLGLEPFDDGVSARQEGQSRRVFPREHTAVVARGFQYNPLRFGRAFREELAASVAVTTYLHATATEIETSRNGASVERVRAATLTGRALTVTAKRFVLATGAIENARLLLASRRNHREGLGNANDLVGRNFMEHPHFYEGLGSVGIWAERLPDLYLPGVATLFFPSEALMRRERLTNVGVNLVERKESINELDHQLLAAARDLDLGPPATGTPAPPSLRLFNVQAEQTPNPASRVTLTDAVDALGVPRVGLEWRLNPLDLDSIHRFLEILCRELTRAGVGRARLQATRSDLPALATWGSHHMGTTRMSVDPKQGVVDADCRVHGIANLYVAGSSVFPTCGAANPTLTNLALSFRLADHLRSRTAAPAPGGARP